MNCVKCGNALESGARFCGACGTQQPGAVIPQAAVRTGAKTMFQGSNSGPIVVNKPTPTPTAGQPQPAVPDKKGPVSSAMSYAATMAPGSAELKVMAPPAPRPAAPAVARPLPASAPVASAQPASSS